MTGFIRGCCITSHERTCMMRGLASWRTCASETKIRCISKWIDYTDLEFGQVMEGRKELMTLLLSCVQLTLCFSVSWWARRRARWLSFICSCIVQGHSFVGQWAQHFWAHFWKRSCTKGFMRISIKISPHNYKLDLNRELSLYPCFPCFRFSRFSSSFFSWNCEAAADGTVRAGLATITEHAKRLLLWETPMRWMLQCGLGRYTGGLHGHCPLVKSPLVCEAW